MKQGTLICMGNFELPDKNAASHRVVNDAKIFRSLGYDTVFLGAKRCEEYFDGIVRTEDFQGFHMYEQSYPFTVKQWVNEIFDLSNLEKLVKTYPDTVGIILYNTQYFTLKKARRLFKGSGIRVLYDCTEWNGFTEGNILKRKVKAFDSKLIENRLQNSAEGIIVVSSKMEKKYSGANLLKLPPLVDTEDGIWHQNIEERNGKYRFVYAGSPSDKERLDTVLRCFSGLPENSAELVIIGVDRESFCKMYPGLEDAAKHPGIEFTGRLSHSETVKNILNSDCCIFLREDSRRNSAGFPTKFAEGFTCGVKIITTKVSDVENYADADCIFTEELSEKAVMEAMQTVIKTQTPHRLKTAFDYKSYIGESRDWLAGL